MKATIFYKIKTATKAQIAEHLTACAADFTPPLNLRINITEYAAKLFAKAVSFEAWHNDDLTGLIACYFNVETKHAFITIVSVSSDYHGFGIAYRLLKNCFYYGEQCGMETIKLEVHEANYRAIRFYEKAGFQTVEKKGDAHFMSLALGTVKEKYAP